MWSYLARIRAPILNNTGSTARDHLASERTFLSWLRMSLAFVALGIAIERFSELNLDHFRERPRSVDDNVRTVFQRIPLQSPKQRPAYSRQSGSSTKTSPSPAHEHASHAAPASFQIDSMALTMLIIGGSSTMYAVARFHTNSRLLRQGMFRPAVYGPISFGAVVLGLSSRTVWKPLKKT